MSGTKIPFIDLAAQQRRLDGAVQQAVLAVMAHGQYVMGPEVAQLEQALAERAGVRHAVSCSSGTDALVLPLMAWGIGPGDAVIVPTFTFAASAESVALVGATPVFADVLPDTFNIDPESVRGAVKGAREAGLRPRAVMPVDLFGQPVDLDACQEVADQEDLLVLADAAQSFGGSWHGRPVGSLGAATATSFFPAKPLGCYGDGGAVFTDDDELAAVLRSVRVHGQGSDKYENVRVGLNARIDTMQAAVLLQKLTIFDDEIAQRQVVADRYTDQLRDVAGTPVVLDGAVSAWAQYTLLVDDRESVVRRLGEQGVPTAVYYPRTLGSQPPYAASPTAPGGTPVAESLTSRVLSLPMHPYLDEATQDRVITAVRSVLA